MKIQSIHSLNARGNVMLDVIRDYFNISSDRMLVEIQGMRTQVAQVLKTKGVNYDDLRAALVPDREKLVRLMAALEYRPDDNVLRLITFY